MGGSLSLLIFKIKKETTAFGEAHVNFSPNFDYLL